MMMESKLPKISIVTPSFNQAEFIEETIQSVLNQGYPNLEYIIIDGGSRDGSVDIIKKYEKYLTYWESKQDRGHAHALNKGFAKATGEVMAWINSDDKYFPWTFATIADIYSQYPDVLWTTGLHANFNRQGVLMAGKSTVRAIYKNIYSYIFRDFHIQQESVFWRRSLWEKTGGYIDENVHLMVDTELWCRFFLHAELWHIDQVIGGYRTYGLNRSHIAIHKQQVAEDINESIDYLMANLPHKNKIVLNQIKVFGEAFHQQNKLTGSITKSIRQNKLLQLIPFMFYDKFCNFIYRKAIKKRGIISLELPVDASLVIKKIERDEEGWKKSVLAWQFPY